VDGKDKKGIAVHFAKRKVRAHDIVAFVVRFCLCRAPWVIFLFFFIVLILIIIFIL
jgi:hypothetical protein